MKRIFLDDFVSAQEKFTDLQVKLEVYFHSSDGEQFVWQPEWKRRTRRFVSEAYRIVGRFEEADMEVQKEEEKKKEHVNFGPIALQLAKGLGRQTTMSEINRVALTVFDFDSYLHAHPSITSIHSQTIYDWVMTLSEQPTSEERKVRLLKQFIITLAPKNSPLQKLAGESPETSQ